MDEGSYIIPGRIINIQVILDFKYACEMARVIILKIDIECITFPKKKREGNRIRKRKKKEEKEETKDKNRKIVSMK